MDTVLKIKKNTCCRYLFFLLGFFSTMPILSLWNITIFNVFLGFSFIYLIFNVNKTIKADKELLLILLFTIVNMGFNYLFGDLPKTYEHSMLFSSFFCILMYSVALLLLNKPYCIKMVLEGFKWSCVVQIIWCLMQIFLYKFMELDLNQLVFIDILKGNPEDQYSHYRYGELVCTGFHKHAANLIPILLFSYLKTNKLPLKAICIFVAFYTKSATVIIAICICVAYEFFNFLKKRLLSCAIKINFKKIALALVFIIVLMFFINYVSEFLIEIYDYVFMRIEGMESTNDSSGVHLNYYYSLPLILKATPFMNLLIGYGTGCSGLPYTRMIGQYEDLVWVVESDVLNTLLNYGIIGFVIFYLLMFKIFFKLKKNKNNISFLVLLLIGCGFLYNVQYMWFMFIQICMMEDKNDSKEIKVIKKICYGE